MDLRFVEPKKYMFHYSKVKERINLFVYYDKNSTQCYETDRVVSLGPTETVEIPTANLSLTRGWAKHINILDKAVVIS